MNTCSIHYHTLGEIHYNYIRIVQVPGSNITFAIFTMDIVRTLGFSIHQLINFGLQLSSEMAVGCTIDTIMPISTFMFYVNEKSHSLICPGPVERNKFNPPVMYFVTFVGSSMGLHTMRNTNDCVC